MKEFRRYSEKSDVYSFGVFLLELVSGREASDSLSSDSSKNLVELVCDLLHILVIICTTDVSNHTICQVNYLLCNTRYSSAFLD